jgi:uncharacterized protein involved in outer membrane biogenesis
MKKILSVLIVLVVLAAGITYWLHNNLDRIARNAIVNYASEMTGAEVVLDAITIDVLSGKCILKNLQVGNPKGFKTPYALKVDQFSVEIDPASIAKEVIEVKKINIDSPDIIYEKGDDMTNFEALQKNVSRYTAEEKNSSDSENHEKESKKLIVKKFDMTNTKVAVSAAFMKGETISINLPDIHLSNIGQSKGGVTPGELGQELVVAIKKQLAESISFKSLVEKSGEVVKSIGDAAGNAVKKLKDLF